tara:strand:- start:127554 stop:128597 length:1044 start_codon:yes stop_codon:yes gene_type:complete
MNIIRLLKSFFCSDIAIDLGSDNTLIYVKDEGLLVNEPSLVAIKEIYPEKQFLQYGSEAQKLVGKTPQGIKVIKPIEKGVIKELYATEAMVEHFMSIVNESGFFKPSPKVLVAIPSTISEVERKAVEDAIYNAGAREVMFVKQGIASAIGAGVDINSTTPSCILDMGAETTEIAVVASGGTVYSKTFEIGGLDLSLSIEDLILEKHNIKIGLENAEKLKKNLGTLVRESLDKREKMVIQGKHVVKNRPVTVEVNQLDVYTGMFTPVTRLLESIDEVLENLAAETVAGLYQNGITMVGGSSKLNGLDKLISEYIGVRTNIANEPTTCAIMGCGKLLEEDATYNDFEDE